MRCQRGPSLPVRCAVLGPCGGLREDEQGTVVTVPTKNHNRFEVDPQPDPEQATWAKLSITVERSDGGIVDAEIIRPRSWIRATGLCSGRGKHRDTEGTEREGQGKTCTAQSQVRITNNLSFEKTSGSIKNSNLEP